MTARDNTRQPVGNKQLSALIRVIKIYIFKCVFTQSQISEAGASHIMLASQLLQGGKKKNKILFLTERRQQYKNTQPFISCITLAVSLT